MRYIYRMRYAGSTQWFVRMNINGKAEWSSDKCDAAIFGSANFSFINKWGLQLHNVIFESQELIDYE